MMSGKKNLTEEQLNKVSGGTRDFDNSGSLATAMSDAPKGADNDDVVIINRLSEVKYGAPRR
ncbi:MAG: bacteriocin [Firmicutes bacterium]|nr:bacteriocin [Bacillota bacterium]